MKVKYSSFLGILVALILVASFVVPGRLASPEPVSANPGLMEWTPVDTPDVEVIQVKSLYSPIDPGTLTEGGSEIVKFLVGNNGTQMYAVVTRLNIGLAGGAPAVDATTSKVRLLRSMNGGRSWTGDTYNYLGPIVNPAFNPGAPDVIVWDIALAPDNPNIIIAAVSRVGALTTQGVYISIDGGVTWENTQWPPTGYAGVQGPGAVGVAMISTLDISMDFGARMILVGVRSAAGTANNIFTMKMPGYGGWNVLNAAGTPASTNAIVGDVIVAKFSPTFNGDSTLVAVYSQGFAGAKPGTWLATAVIDIAQNRAVWQDGGSHVEVKNSTANPNSSAYIQDIIVADLEMPSDFSGQSASLRRFYVSIDALDGGVHVAANRPVNRGVYRIDDNVVYTLMDNSTTFFTQAQQTPSRRAHSIAYWGTYASGKLLVGESLGSGCDATVGVWFTDSPTVCPIPCWYPAKKPPTGAAGQVFCWPGITGFGNAWVVWSPTFAAQGVAYTSTGSMSYDGPFAVPANQANAQLAWPGGIFNLVPLDESAFSLTRNNGETWNQLSLIDTRMNKLTDVAPSMDCTTVYLASVNNGQQCTGFDSIWRSSTNEKVVAPPLPALPIGQVWERVRAHVSALSCNQAQSNYIIIRLAPDKLDGQVPGWAAGGTSLLGLIGNFPVGANTRQMEWSPDFGDYWADITPRIAIQDFAWETSTIIYVLDTNGNVQKMPYTGTAWASTLNNVAANTGGGHTIEALAPDKVLVGNRAGAPTSFPAGISTNGGTSFVPMVRPTTTPPNIGYHVLFDTDYAKNSTIYIGSDGGASSATHPAAVGPPTGLVFRNTAPAGSNTEWTNMMTGMCFIGYVGPHFGYFGLAQSNSKNVTGQGTLYAAHYWEVGMAWSGVERTLAPLDGIPKPGLEWTCMDASVSTLQAAVFRGPVFSLEPESLKICGCLTQDTNSTLYAIDNNYYSNNHNVTKRILDRLGVAITVVKSTGLLWEYTDCMAKKGPKLTLDDGAIIGCDPASGRNQEVNFRWEQLCVATLYQLQINKDKAFTLGVFDSSQPLCGVVAGPFGIVPVDVTSPAMVYFAGGGAVMPTPVSWAGVPLPGWAAAAVPALECGHLYYWRVRVLNEVTDDEVNSPWSEARSFTIKAGFRVTTPYYGPQLLSPDNGCACPCDTPIAFSWSPFKETTGYKIQISANADMSAPLEEDSNVPTTAYMAKKAKFECGKMYFWRVQSVKPAPSEWSATFSFSIQPRPPAPPTPPTPKEPATPFWVWVVIAIGAILVIVTLVLIFKTRRV